MDKAKTIDRAKALRSDELLEESQQLLLDLLEQYPYDPQVLFEVGGSYDVMGEEGQAIPYYRRAMEKGLTGSDLQECMVCLGSSLRVTGKFDDAVEILEEAVERFPDKNSGKLFLALAYYSQKQYEESVRLLLTILLETTQDEDVLAYADALHYYKENLDEVIAD